MGIAGIFYGNQTNVMVYQRGQADSDRETQNFVFSGDSGDNGQVNGADRTSPIAGVQVYNREARLSSNIIGLGALEDGTIYSASYAVGSTAGDPVIEIRMELRNGEKKVFQVSVSEVDPSNASQLEMFALCAHADAQELAGCHAGADTYRKMLEYAEYSNKGDVRAKNAMGFLSDRQDWTAMVTDERIETLDQEGKADGAYGKILQNLYQTLGQRKEDSKMASLSETEVLEQALLDKVLKDNGGVPYGYLAKNGVIEYNGVTFVCDPEHNALHLGDTSNPKNCIRIPLSKGGCLIVNRDNIDGLAKAIGMFSPEDVKLILQAIAQDAKVQQMQHEIEDESSGLDLAEQTGGNGSEEIQLGEEMNNAAGEEEKEG